MRRRGRRRKQLLDVVKEQIRHWNLKDEVLENWELAFEEAAGLSRETVRNEWIIIIINRF
jgi:hypothetical protein